MEMTEWLNGLSPESMGEEVFTAVFNHKIDGIPLFKFTLKVKPIQEDNK